jgi:hypothetical protein
MGHKFISAMEQLNSGESREHTDVSILELGPPNSVGKRPLSQAFCALFALWIFEFSSVVSKVSVPSNYGLCELICSLKVKDYTVHENLVSNRPPGELGSTETTSDFLLIKSQFSLL